MELIDRELTNKIKKEVIRQPTVHIASEERKKLQRNFIKRRIQCN